MRNGMMKKAAAILLAAAMTVPGYAVYAEENTQVEAEAAEAEAKAEAERQAAEAAAQAEAERQAAEAAAQAEAERQAAEAAAQAEAERQAAEAVAQAEAERQAAEAAAQAEAERQAAEAAAQTEAETEVQTEEAQTEAETEEEYQTSFKFENDEVIIVVKTSKEAKLSKDTKLTAKKLEEGSEKYEAAKAATINSLGSTEEHSYSFYEISFEKDGKELDVQDSQMTVDVTFKNEAEAVQVKDGAAKRL